MATASIQPTSASRFIYATHAVWANTRNGSGAVLVTPTGTTPDYLLGVMAYQPGTYWIYRTFLKFDLSSLPVTATINAAALKVWVYIMTGGAAHEIVLTQGYQADPVVVANFDTAGYTQRDDVTSLGSETKNNLAAGAYRTIDFNAAGKAAISAAAGGTLLLCLRAKHDIDNIINGLADDQFYFYSEQETDKEPSIEVTDYDDPAGVWVTACGLDVESKILGVRIERGRDAELGYAAAGVCELLMDNSSGDFSPENAGGAYYPTLDLGCAISVRQNYDGVDYQLFTGKIESITPEALPGDGGSTAFLLCIDGMDDLANVPVETALFLAGKAGIVVTDILDDADAYAGARDIDAGITTFDLMTFSGITALAALRQIDDQERSFHYVDVDGDFQWEDRHHRSMNHLASEYDFGEKLKLISYEWSKRDLFNRLQIIGTRYTASTVGNELMWSVVEGAAGSAVIVPAGGSVTIWAVLPDVIESLLDPSDGGGAGGGSGIYWASNTEADGTGADTSGSITLTYVAYGRSVKLTFTSTHAADSFLTEPAAPPVPIPDNRTALLIGKVYFEDQVGHIAEDAVSQGAYGKKGQAITAPSIGDPDELRTLADFLISRYKDPNPVNIKVTVFGRTDWPTDDILKQVLARKISDRITIASTLLGVDQDYYIEKVIHDFKSYQGVFALEVTWYLSRASDADKQRWLLETVGFSELEETTYLSY